MQKFFLRFKHSGPEFAQAKLLVERTDGPGSAMMELPEKGVAPSGFREYGPMTLGELPFLPGIQLRVILQNGEGDSFVNQSNRLTINAVSNEIPPFHYTPIFFLQIAQNFGVPGVGGGYWCEGTDESEVYVDGVRGHGGGAGLIRAQDAWHIGSCTKAVTSTFLGLLIQRGTATPGTGAPLSWNTSLFEIFGPSSFGDDLHPRFQNTTLLQLACHRSGLRMNGTENSATRDMSPGSLNLTNPRQLRRLVTESLLTRQHFEDGQPTVPTLAGTDFYYGSGNYLVLASVIEELLNDNFEDLIRQQFLTPLLGVAKADFGMPTDLGFGNEPHGHRREVEYPFAIYPDNTPLEPAWNAAGGLYLTFDEWLAFCRLHIRGFEGGNYPHTNHLGRPPRALPFHRRYHLCPGMGSLLPRWKKEARPQRKLLSFQCAGLHQPDRRMGGGGRGQHRL
ncbi:MAG: serine hydrolase [Verrucomicrobiota bacterium JB023]|nr:serine hydrolase [Verrucomicrobiota bacterium JB023]